MGPQGIENIVVFGLVHDVCVFFTASDAKIAFPDANVNIIHEMSAGFYGDLSHQKVALDTMIADAPEAERETLQKQVDHTLSLSEFSDIDVAKSKYANIGVNSLEYDSYRHKAIVE